MNLYQQGFTIVSGVLSRSETENLIEMLGPVSGAGRRGLLGVPAVKTLACSPGITALLRPHMEGEPRPVRTIYFDKSSDANWVVAWHQDLTIAVAQRIDVPGFGPWSTKDGVPHVQPPAELLGRMLTLRLHLDDCDASNGALRVIPGSHRHGRLPQERIQEMRTPENEVLCVSPAGGALLMRPLLLHASGKSLSNRHRRILHVEYADFDLPGGLEWHESVQRAVA